MTKTSSRRRQAGGLSLGPQTNRGCVPPRIQTAQVNEPGVQTGSSQKCRWAWTPPKKQSIKSRQIKLVVERNHEECRNRDQHGIPGRRIIFLQSSPRKKSQPEDKTLKQGDEETGNELQRGRLEAQKWRR